MLKELVQNKSWKMVLFGTMLRKEKSRQHIMNSVRSIYTSFLIIIEKRYHNKEQN